MKSTRLILGLAWWASLGSLAMADAPLVDCVGSGCGGGGPTTYAYLVDSVSYPMMEFRVGTNDLDPAHYANVLVPEGWEFAVEAQWMHHLHGVCTPHGEDSPGPCWCLTAGSVRWWTDDPALAVEYFTFGYDHPWPCEDVAWELTTRREGPPPEYFVFTEDWDGLVGYGGGPVHGPYGPQDQCWSNDDCPADHYCLFQPCAIETGICVPRPETCPFLWDPVCGCDGVTYPNDCVAALEGMSIDYWGECDRIPCYNNDDCSYAEGVYCRKEPGDCSGPGNCTLRPSPCPEYAQPVCGCDGLTYDNPCFTAEAGVNIAYMGSCLPGDFDLDADVDLYDYQVFAECMNGPDTEMPLPCASTDLDYDVDVDLADFRTFQAGFEPHGPPRIESYANSGCLDLPGMGPCPEDDVIELTVDGDTLHVLHQNVTYNCCLDDIAISLTVEGDVLHLTEEEILTSPCYCICCYDVTADVVNLAPGEYTVEFCWYDYELDEVRCYTEVIVVPPEPSVGSYGNSGCLEPPGEGPCPDDDVIGLVVEGNTLNVLHSNVTYNCCLDDIVLSLEMEGNVLHLTEEEVLIDPCYCICCYDFAAAVVDLAPGEYVVEYCWYDYETDQEQCYVETIVVMGACGHVEDYWNSGCLERDGDEPCVEDDEVELAVSPGTLHVIHWNATYNCCPDDIVVSLTIQGTLLRLDEEEILSEPCDCMCCYNVEATVADLTPGEYTVEYCWQDWETGGERCHVEIVLIP